MTVSYHQERTLSNCKKRDETDGDSEVVLVPYHLVYRQCLNVTHLQPAEIDVGTGVQPLKNLVRVLLHSVLDVHLTARSVFLFARQRQIIPARQKNTGMVVSPSAVHGADPVRFCMFVIVRPRSTRHVMTQHP